eukprot:CAMPEP_0206228468 /NCGR_PEP_ID=MMETSP0047_2-20121206/9185_1 /ASSEMBLY_ACC=CAM_ASM_000192 /TAXON_ID=195065 /ORGANISM="Chroomonas mesostigmatica_cf, Strain CCMP1168" /LENGTH=562 /DNA_ID=CAMNT_0053651713 /DNA_START=117 /DNA_END=1801 /DNA_ORIENTATION=+
MSSSTPGSMAGYDKGKMLNKGAFGQAWLARDKKSGKDYVIKTVDVSKLSKKERDASRKEVQILGALFHPNIIEYREAFEDSGQLCIVMAFAEGGDLTGRIKAQGGRPFTEDVILDWFVQICLAMKHVHDRKILHRDLKSQNIFLTGRGKLIKLGDFGIAKVLGSTSEVAKTAIGTPYYLSPEICEGKPYNNKSDVWSLGVILYELCMLRCPFDASNLHGLVLKIIRGVYLPISPNFSPALKNLVNMLLTKKPSARPSINQILTMPVLTARIASFLDDNVRKAEFSHTVIHGVRTELADVSGLETQKKPLKQLVGVTPPKAAPPSRFKAPSPSSAAPSTARSSVSGASDRSRASAAGAASRISARGEAVRTPKSQETELKEREEERARQDRMARGARAVAGAHDRALNVGANADNNFLQLKKQQEIDSRERELAKKREKEREELAKLRDARRREFLQKQREAESERRRAAAAAAGKAVDMPCSRRESAQSTPEPTGIQIFTKVEVGRRQDEIVAAERRKAFQEQQAEAERNRRRALQDVGVDVTPSAPAAKPSEVGAKRTPSG